MMLNRHTTTPNQDTVEQDRQKLVNEYTNLYWKTYHEPKTCLEDSATERNKQLEKIVEELLLTLGAALRVVRKTNGPVTTELSECANPIEYRIDMAVKELTSKAKEVLGLAGMANGSQASPKDANVNPSTRMLNRMKVLLKSIKNLKELELNKTTPEDTNIDDMPAIKSLDADINSLKEWVTELKQENQNTDQSGLCNNTDRIAMIKRLSGAAEAATTAKAAGAAEAATTIQKVFRGLKARDFAEAFAWYVKWKTDNGCHKKNGLIYDII